MDLSVSEETLARLVCPETHQPLRLATGPELAQWDATAPLEGALVTLDGTRAYPVRNGFPIVVAAEALRRAGGPTGSA